MIVIGNMTSPLKKRFCERFQIRVQTAGYQAMRVLTTFALSVVSFVFFRAESVRDGFYYLERMVTRFDVWSLTAGNIYYMGLDQKEMKILGIGIFILFLVDWCYEKKKVYIDTMIKEQCLAIQFILSIAIVLSIFIFGIYGTGYDATQFIYFQF